MGNLFSWFVNKRYFDRIYKCVPEDDLYVHIDQGVLKGRKFNSVLSGYEYCGFLGIPYAKPPVGELRFQAPQPPEPWYGVYDALYERSICEQVTFMFWRRKFIFGSEDCLYLNVYTPRVPGEITERKAVMVFIHGGGFCLGSGSRNAYSPDYLITRDVIIVTINYRLHILGFLNLGLPECPGNVGLKDQVMALKWVKENIYQFGGDPENITIFGESAGGSSVHYHLLSPMSKGLFNKAIMESGTAMSPWGIVYKPIEQALEVGRFCGYKGSDDVRELLKYLKKVSSKTLAGEVFTMILTQRQIYPARFNNMGPSVEDIKEGAFLPDWPQNLAKIATPVPTIFGVNDKEGLLIFMNVMSGKLVEKLRQDFSIFLTHNFKINPSLAQPTSVAIKNYYFGDKEVGMGTASEIVDLYSDLTFFYGYEAIEFLINSDHPPFIYEFTYEGSLNLIERMINLFKRTNIKGAAHGDELFYLFFPQIFLMYPSLKGDTLRKIEEMTLMWTNFAKLGDPSGAVKWKPSTANKPCYLKIDKNSRMIKGKVYGKRLEFLKNLLKTVIDVEAQPYDIFDYVELLTLLHEIKNVS